MLPAMSSLLQRRNTIYCGESVACGNPIGAQLRIEANACNGPEYGVHVTMMTLTGTPDDHGPRRQAKDSAYYSIAADLGQVSGALTLK